MFVYFVYQIISTYLTHQVLSIQQNIGPIDGHFVGARISSDLVLLALGMSNQSNLELHEIFDHKFVLRGQNYECILLM